MGETVLSLNTCILTTAEYNLSVDRYADNVYRFIYSNVKNEPMAKDVVQDAYLRLWESKEEVDGVKVKSWLFKTAYRVMIDCLRREKRRGDINQINEGSLKNEDQYSDLQEILHEALSKLPEQQKTVVLLRDYEGYSYKEIEEITGLKESQVKVYIFRARKTLKEYLVDINFII